jgi:hypothetical protein
MEPKGHLHDKLNVLNEKNGVSFCVGVKMQQDKTFRKTMGCPRPRHLIFISSIFSMFVRCSWH